MRITRLQLIEFRNFQRQELELRPRLNFLLGDNGQGKTNLLEAIHLLCRGISFRAADSKSLIKRDGPGRSRISAGIVSRGLDYQVEMSLEPGKKSAAINGKKVNSAALMGHFPVVLFSPESLTAIKEGPEQRRQLIDELLISHDPKQGRLLREFTRALKARNRLLKNLSEGIGDRRGNELSLESLNKIYFLLSSHLTTARIRALLDLQPSIREAMWSILDEKTADISVDYVISGDSALDWGESQVYDALLKRHQVLEIQEKASGGSLVGPHKHDIKILFEGHDSRFYCSQGQQRALILALKIAQVLYHYRVHGHYPVLLLDDVMSELDAKKRVNLMKFIEDISAQILITATDLTWSQDFDMSRNSVFTISAGQTSQASLLR